MLLIVNAISPPSKADFGVSWANCQCYQEPKSKCKRERGVLRPLEFVPGGTSSERERRPKPLAADIDRPVTADVAFSDTDQYSTPYQNPVLSYYVVGVVPFVWVLASFYPWMPPVALTNITDVSANAALNGRED